MRETTRSGRASATLRVRFVAALRRALGQFLALPLAVVLFFIAFNIGVFYLDEAWSRGRGPAAFSWLGTLLGDSRALNSLLTTIASSIITVTSITFSLLLVAVQQGASSLTAQVTDQFLMRRTNQFYFGFFVGLSVFTLLTLVTASSIHRPVFGTSVALLMTTIALCMIVVMIYNTIDQMRPARIVHAIHEYVLCARMRERPLLEATRRRPRAGWVTARVVRSQDSGHLVAIDLPRLERLLAASGDGQIELQLLVPVGARLALHDPVLALRVDPALASDAERLSAVARDAVHALVYDDGRDLKRDAAYGLYQLSTIGWTTISTAKSNPSPGQEVIHGLRDVIARWSRPDARIDERADAMVVCPDDAMAAALDVLETMIVAASESLQAQTLSDGLRSVAILIDEADPETATRLCDVARRALSSLGEHVPTRELEAALRQLADALAARGFGQASVEVTEATDQLLGAVGRLGSRGTRVG